MNADPQELIESALSRAVSVVCAPVAAQLSALEHSESAEHLDWALVFSELKALRPVDELSDWWDSVIIATLATALAPLDPTCASLPIATPLEAAALTKVPLPAPLLALPPMAMDIINSIQRDGREFLFGQQDKGFQRWNEATKALRGRLGDMQHWTLHDIRRTFRTGLGKLGIPNHVAEYAINHVSKPFMIDTAIRAKSLRR